jgi:hypothetical protein
MKGMASILFIRPMHGINHWTLAIVFRLDPRTVTTVVFSNAQPSKEDEPSAALVQEQQSRRAKLLLS